MVKGKIVWRSGSSLVKTKDGFIQTNYSIPESVSCGENPLWVCFANRRRYSSEGEEMDNYMGFNITQSFGDYVWVMGEIIPNQDGSLYTELAITENDSKRVMRSDTVQMDFKPGERKLELGVDTIDEGEWGKVVSILRQSDFKDFPNTPIVFATARDLDEILVNN